MFTGLYAQTVTEPESTTTLIAFWGLSGLRLELVAGARAWSVPTMGGRRLGATHLNNSGWSHDIQWGNGIPPSVSQGLTEMFHQQLPSLGFCWS